MSEIRTGAGEEASNGSKPTGSLLQWQMLRRTEWVLQHKLQFKLGLIALQVEIMKSEALFAC